MQCDFIFAYLRLSRDDEEKKRKATALKTKDCSYSTLWRAYRSLLVQSFHSLQMTVTVERPSNARISKG